MVDGHSHCFAADAHANRADVAFLKKIINKSAHQAGFANGKVAE
jgi:hypothetical protein